MLQFIPKGKKACHCGEEGAKKVKEQYLSGINLFVSGGLSLNPYGFYQGNCVKKDLQRKPHHPSDERKV